MLHVADMPGLWHRSLLVRADGTRDTSTWVAWLQGQKLFADLRLPAGRPSFRGVRGLDDFTRQQTEWLARQEGFAGQFDREGEYFVWHRVLDYQPKSAAADAGRLRQEGDYVVEEGRDTPYVEHWHREPGPTAPVVAARLRDQKSGRDGFIVRVGAAFMYARAGIGASLPTGSLLADHVEAAPSLRAAQELVDCEISFGRVTELGGWLIERSSLPFREGAHLDPALDPTRHAFRSSDVTGEGHEMCRNWAVVELEGDAAALHPPTVQGHGDIRSTSDEHA
jgi:hypothetical protein